MYSAVQYSWPVTGRRPQLTHSRSGQSVQLRLLQISSQQIWLLKKFNLKEAKRKNSNGKELPWFPGRLQISPQDAPAQQIWFGRNTIQTIWQKYNSKKVRNPSWGGQAGSLAGECNCASSGGDLVTYVASGGDTQHTFNCPELRLNGNVLSFQQNAELALNFHLTSVARE